MAVKSKSVVLDRIINKKHLVPIHSVISIIQRKYHPKLKKNKQRSEKKKEMLLYKNIDYHSGYT